MKREKLPASSRTGNVQAIIPQAPSEPFDAMTASERLHDLIDNAFANMRQSLLVTNKFTPQQTRDSILVVVDGTSPIAPESIRGAGPEKFAINVLLRKFLVDTFRAKEPEAARRLSVPAACGHLQYFVSTSMGGALECTVCDLRLTAPLDVDADVDANAGANKDANAAKN